MPKRYFLALPQMFVGIIFYIIHYILRNTLFMYNFLLIRHYIADYLALIVSIPVFINIQVLFNVRKIPYIKFYEIIFYFLLISIVYEIICPFILNRGTFDPIDFLFYGLGGIVLYFSQKTRK